MRKETKVVGIVLALVLTIALVLSIISTGVAQAAANPVRDMPESVEVGADFTVTITWTAPADNFNAIGLTDNANATANMAVSGNAGWCSPNADAKTTVNNIIEYVWFGPYSIGTGFTAVYSVHVPIGAPEGNYTFDGNLSYYIAGSGAYTEDIAGDSVIRVVKAPIGPTPTVTPTPIRRGGGAQEPSGTDWEAQNDYSDVVAVTPTPTPTQRVTPTVSLPVTPTPTPSPSPSPTPSPKGPGFEAIFAIAGLLAVAYLTLRSKKKR